MLNMSEKYKGIFSSSFMSLQLQLKTLLEGTGGEEALRFLDALSNLSISEQNVALNVFTNVVNRIESGEKRLLNEGDLARKEFEDRLYSDILEAMRDAAVTASNSRLTVVNGGKDPTSRKKMPISINTARRNRKAGLKPVIN